MISLTIEGIDFFVYIGVTKKQEVSIISHKKEAVSKLIVNFQNSQN
jgi:hypothetical protein